MFISDEVINGLIKEDVPYFDLTTTVLGIGFSMGRISFKTVDRTVLSATEEAARILQQVGAQITFIYPSGQFLSGGATFLEAEGTVESLHLGWKVAQNLLEYACGVATKTRQLVEDAQGINPNVMLYTTRKSIPGTKAIAIKSILAGGGFPHRLGLSETILIFEEHLGFLGGVQGLVADLKRIKNQAKEKKIIVEVKNLENAFDLIRGGVDGIQFDKVGVDKLNEIVPELRKIYPHVLILAAGGINESNIKDFAKTGVDGLVSTAPYYAKPLDIKVEMIKIDNNQI